MHFGPNKLEDFMGCFTKLQQTNTMHDYVITLEIFSKYTIDVLYSFLKS